MKQKKLSIFIYSLAGGGAERIVSELCSELYRHFNITLILMNTTIDYKIIGVKKIIYLEKSSFQESGFMKFIKLPFLSYKYYRLIKKHNIEISLSLLSRPNYISVFSKFFGHQSKIIISEHSFPSKMYSGTSIQSRINHFLIRKLYPKSDTIISISKRISYDLEINFYINKLKIHQIYNPFDFNRIKEQSLKKVCFNFNRYTYITIGRLDDGKNHALLIEAFSKLNKDDNQLIILGTGKNKILLLELIEKLSLVDKVFLLGFDVNPYKYLSYSDCFILSSNYEGLPTVIIEALACNLPVISTDCESGPREILSPKSNFNKKLVDRKEIAEYGILVPVANCDILSEAMIEIRSNKELAQNFKLKSQQAIQPFSKDKIIYEYINVLKNLL